MKYLLLTMLCATLGCIPIGPYRCEVTSYNIDDHHPTYGVKYGIMVTKSEFDGGSYLIKGFNSIDEANQELKKLPQCIK